MATHGGLNRAGKVRMQTPQINPQEKPRKKNGRARKRALFTRRFVVGIEGNSMKR